MRTRTQLSSLAIAAIAILAAATTSFAQTNDRGAETANTVTVSGIELTAINAKQSASIDNTIRESFVAKNISETKPVVKPLGLSAAAFSPATLSAGSRFATVDANQFIDQQQRADMRMSASVSPTANAEFSETKTKGVEFVPSRIPKFPYREN
jgi:hypothetical protein